MSTLEILFKIWVYTLPGPLWFFAKPGAPAPGVLLLAVAGSVQWAIVGLIWNGINACPDSEYPIRILEAYLAMNTETYCEGSGGAEELADIMNEAQEERAALLHRAISLLQAGEVS